MKLDLNRRLITICAVFICFCLPLFSVVTMSIEEPSYSLHYFDEITISVNIADASIDMRAYKVHLAFDPTYLEVADLTAFHEGPFLNEIGRTQFYVDGSNGEYNVTCSLLGITSGALGSGNLFTVTLKAKNHATGAQGTDIVLSDPIVRDVLNQPIPVGTLTGSNVVIEAIPLYTQFKVFLQGPYQTGGTMRHALSSVIPLTSPFDATHTVTALPNVSPHYIVDWVYVQLRATTTATPEQGQSAFLLENGTIVARDGTNLLEFEYTSGYSYYLIVRHRNHLGIMSATARTLSSSISSPTYIDLTALNSVYGGNFLGVKEIETGVLAMYGGDANRDGFVSPTDRNSYWRIQAGQAGYKSADFDLDGNVFPNDRNAIWRINSGKQSQIP